MCSVARLLVALFASAFVQNTILSCAAANAPLQTYTNPILDAVGADPFVFQSCWHIFVLIISQMGYSSWWLLLSAIFQTKLKAS
jgi:hypothetical protein